MGGELIFVTGASGFIGSHVARLLIGRGFSVRVLARNSSLRSNLEGLDCEVVIGDLRDEGSLERCVQGCRRVFHVAADYRLWARNTSEIYASNVAGTRNLLTACCEAGVEKVVYTSTIGTLQPRTDGQPADEDCPVSLDDMIGHYNRSKYMAEQVAREFASAGLPVVIVNPAIPVGAGDVRPTPTGRIILDFIRGRMPAYIDTGINLAGVRDIAEGHLLASERGRPGERFVLGGENWDISELLDELVAISGKPTPRVRIPWPVALAAAYMDEFAMGRVLGREPNIPVEGVRMSRYKMFVSSERARRLLGYNPGPVRQALREAVQYFMHDWQPATARDRVSSMSPGRV